MPTVQWGGGVCGHAYFVNFVGLGVKNLGKPGLRILTRFLTLSCGWVCDLLILKQRSRTKLSFISFITPKMNVFFSYIQAKIEPIANCVKIIRCDYDTLILKTINIKSKFLTPSPISASLVLGLWESVYGQMHGLDRHPARRLYSPEKKKNPH